MRFVKIIMLFFAVAVLVGCEDDDKKEDSSAESSRGGQTYPWQDPSTVSRSHTYSVSVVNPRNQSVAGASVTLTLEGYGSTQRATTGANGAASFTFNAPPNVRFYIQVQSTGYQPAALAGTTGSGGGSSFHVTLADL